MSGYRQIALLLAAALACGCSVTRGKPFDPALVGRDLYLCCNMSFNTSGAASDANYETYIAGQVYRAGPWLPAGTKVKVTKVGASGVEFQSEDYFHTFTLGFHYGTKQLTPAQYFRNILRAQSPLGALDKAPPSIASAMRAGKLLTGMTKEQVLFTRGHPPAHKTPSLERDEWIYYSTPGFVDRVVFSAGKVTSVTRGPAP